MEGKPWWQSKTVWLNVVLLVISVAGVALTTAKEHGLAVSPLVGFALAMVVNVGNIVLRLWFTKEPLTK